LVVQAQSDVPSNIHQDVQDLDTEVKWASCAISSFQIVSKGWSPEVLLIVDQNLGQDAMTLCQHLRSHAVLATVYIVLVTNQQEQTMLGQPGGPDDTLPSDFHPGTLKQILRTALRSRANDRIVARREKRKAMDWLSSVIAHEINNPLAAAMASAEFLQELLITSPDTQPRSAQQQKDIDEVLSDTKAVLDRINQALQRLCNKGEDLVPTAPSLTTLEAIAQRIASVAQEVMPDRVDIKRLEDPTKKVICDANLLTHAVKRVLAEAGSGCDGRAKVSLHLSQWRLAVILEFNDPLAKDPDMILEPRLESIDGSPPQYYPALSCMEDSFAQYGGLIFSRPVDGRWRYGLTIPIQKESA
jgi:DNA-binding response OmpR family regulator